MKYDTLRIFFFKQINIIIIITIILNKHKTCVRRVFYQQFELRQFSLNAKFNLFSLVPNLYFNCNHFSIVHKLLK